LINTTFDTFTNITTVYNTAKGTVVSYSPGGLDSLTVINRICDRVTLLDVVVPIVLMVLLLTKNLLSKQARKDERFRKWYEWADFTLDFSLFMILSLLVLSHAFGG
jgi:hypothetical protein